MKFSRRNIRRLLSGALSWYGIALMWLVIPVLIHHFIEERGLVFVAVSGVLTLIAMLFILRQYIDRRLSDPGLPIDWQPESMNWKTDVKVEKKDS